LNSPLKHIKQTLGKRLSLSSKLFLRTVYSDTTRTAGSVARFPGLAEDATSKAGTFTLDPTKNPKEMDSTSDQQAVSLGIYELEADSYKVCFSPAGKARPVNFSSDPGSGQIFQVWQRQKNN